jgi:cytochrome d ubiquinol oxidase subunit II
MDPTGIVGALLTLMALVRRREGVAMLTSSLSIAGIVLSVGASMFPFILPSSIQPQASLTVWDASSSHLTLFIMLVATCIFLPLILLYTSWVYKVLWGKVVPGDISGGTSHAY